MNTLTKWMKWNWWNEYWVRDGQAEGARRRAIHKKILYDQVAELRHPPREHWLAIEIDSTVLWTDQMKNNLDKLCRLAGNDFKLIFSRDSRRLSRLELSRPLRTQAAHVDHRQVKEEGLCLQRLHVRRVGLSTLKQPRSRSFSWTEIWSRKFSYVVFYTT